MPALRAANARTDVDWAGARLLAWRSGAAAAVTQTRPTSARDAIGATLAAPLAAASDLPPFDTAAMDGYAVSGAGPWLIVDPVGAAAGHPWNGRLGRGEAVPVATGAVVPAGATAVLPIEDAAAAPCADCGPAPAHRGSHPHGGSQAHGRSASAPTHDLLGGAALGAGRHIRLAGSDARAGEVLAPTGARVTAAMAGLAAAAGSDRLTVFRPPTARALVTGDELVGRDRRSDRPSRRGSGRGSDQGPGQGAVRDAIGPMLAAAIVGFGGSLHALRRVADDVDLRAPLLAADEDVLLVSGSTSVGRGDRLRPALREIGAEFVVDGVAARPGHPMLLATITPADARIRHVVGLPGNPYAAFVALHTLARPLLHGLAGRRLEPLPVARLAGAPPAARPGATRILPVRWTDDGTAVEPCRGHSSACLRGAAAADALAAVDPADDRVRLILL